MKNHGDASLRIRLAGMAILALFIVLAVAAYVNGRQVQHRIELIATDAVPGTVYAHKMRMAMSRSIGWVMVAASAQTSSSRDASLKIVHDADAAFTNALKQYNGTIIINPVADRTLLNQVTGRYAEYYRQRLAYEALIRAGNRTASANFLESNLVPAYVSVLQPAEELVNYNHANSLTYADYIRHSVQRLYWAVAIVVVLGSVCAVVLVVNFSIRRREVAELRDSEEKFSKAFRSNPSGIAITDMASGEYLEVNESFCRILGYSPPELIGRNPVEVGVWTSAKERNQAFQSLLAGETLRDFELQTRTRGGGSRTLLVSAELVVLRGKPCIVSMVQDITERKRSMEQVEMLKVSIDKHFDAAYWLDAGNQFVYVNDTACKVLGYAREELLGKPLTLVSPHLTPQILDQAWQGLRETGFFSRESVHRRKDGSEFPVEIAASYVRFEGKELHCGFARDITARKRAEKAMVASEAALKEAQHLAHIGSSMWDARTDKTSWSDELYQIVGWDPALSPPTHAERKKIYTPESFAILDRAAKRALAAGEPYDLQLDIIRPNGDRRHVHVRGTCTRDQNGVITGLRGTMQDITERKQLEQKQAELAAIVNSSDDAIIGKSLTGIITSWNRGAEKIFGYSAAEAIGRPLLMLIPADRHHEETDVLEKIGRGEAVEHYETMRVRKDGRQIYISATISPLRDARGLVIGASKIARDITLSKQAKLELMWKTAFLEAQVDSALDGILVVDDRTKRILQNRKLFQLFKVPEAIARDDDDDKLLQHVLGRVKAPEKFSERVAQLYAHPDAVGRDEIELVDGTILDRYSSPVRDKAGRYYGRIWTFRDITEQRALEVQYRQSQKMEAFGQLAGGVAHDFNNLLGIIVLYVGILKSEEKLPPPVLEHAGEIEKAAQSAANLTRQLLLFSRQHALQAQNLDLNAVVDNITKLLQRTLGEQFEIQFKRPDHPLIIHADAGMMEQILLNLTVNARDAMPRGGQIVVATVAVELDEVLAAQIHRARPGPFVCLSVTDTGTGIPPEILPRIFEPFFTTKEVGKGTGLGLATVFGIVQQHKGWINVLSEPGRGTTFQIYLPQQKEAPAPNSAAAQLPLVVGGHETILLVEDEVALRTSTHLYLTRLGYRVLTAETGVAALNIWRQHHDEISLVLTDLVMPCGMTGKELGACLLADHPRLKIIFTSGYCGNTLSQDFVLETGVNFLVKPFSCQQLAKIVRDNLDKTG